MSLPMICPALVHTNQQTHCPEELHTLRAKPMPSGPFPEIALRPTREWGPLKSSPHLSQVWT